MIVGATAERPVELAFAFLDGQVVDARVTMMHQAIGTELPVFVAV